MASAKRRGDGWCVRWRTLDGKERRRQAPDKRTADAIVLEIAKAHALGRDWTPRPDSAAEPERRAPALAAAPGVDTDDAIGAYLDATARHWRPSTYRIRETSLSVFAAWVQARDGRRLVPLSVLSRALFDDYWKHLVTVRGNATNTANERVRHAVAFWQWAADHDEWGDEVPHCRAVRLTGTASPRSEAPTWAEMDAAIRSARVSQDEQYSGIPMGAWDRLMFLLRCTGLRPGQGMRLLWPDFDLRRRVLVVRGELGKSKAEQRGRIIPISPHLADEMAGWGRRVGHVIPWRDSRQPHHKTARALWERTDAAPAVYRQPLHCFRHGFISELARAGVPAELRRRLTGHAGDVHEDTYTADEAVLAPLREVLAVVPAFGSTTVLRFAGRTP